MFVRLMDEFVGDELLSVPTTAGGTALASVPDGTSHAYFYARSNDVIFRATSGSLGGAPDSTHGVTIPASTGYDYTGDPRRLKFLGSGGVSNLYAAYYKAG